MSSENKKTEFTWDERVAMLVAKARKDLQKLKAAKKARDYICKMNAEKKKMDRVLRPFYTSQWLDVKDTDDKWLEAQIVDIHKTLGSARVHIHYKGWKTKYDEYLLLEECNDETSTVSERLAPYLSKSKPEAVGDGKVLPRPGMRVDVLDTTDHWRQAEIVKKRMCRDGPMVLVHYIGWGSVFDEWINAESYRIAEVHTRTGR